MSDFSLTDKGSNSSSAREESRQHSDYDAYFSNEVDPEIVTLKEELAANPYDYSIHIALIDLLKSKNNISLLNNARSEMSTIFPLSEELWIDWINDEILYFESTSSKIRVCELFEKAINDYQSVKIWLKYCQYKMDVIESRSDVDDIRALFERALKNAGLHFTEASSIWDGYRDFEDNILISLINLNQNSTDMETQKQRVLSIFTRQLSTPLISLKNTKTIYDTWIADYKIEEHDVSILYENALKKMQEIMPFEEAISESNTSQSNDYLRYIEYEIRCNEPLRVISLFERAVKEHYHSEKLWKQYMDFLIKQTVDFEVISNVAKRSVRNIPTSSNIWILYLRILENYNQDSSIVSECFNNALNSGIEDSLDFLNIRLHYGYYLIRNKQSTNDTIVKFFKTSIYDQNEQFGDLGDSEHKLLRCLANVYQFVCKDLLEALECWKLLISSHSRSSSYWQEYINIAKQFYDSNTIINLYKQSLSYPLDYPMQICEDFINFEIFNGTLKTVLEAENITEKSIRTYHDNKKKRYDENPRTDYASYKKPIKKNEPDIKKQKRKATDITPKPEKVLKPLQAEILNEPKLLQPENIGIDKNVSVFISNIDFNCTENDIQTVFSEIGPILSVFIMKNKEGQSKGYGFVQFNDKECVELALKKDRKFRLGSRPIFISPVVEKEKRQANKFDSDNTNCLYVSKIHPKVKEKELEDIFSHHKGFKQVRLATYHNGNSKGFAYISFETHAGASAALIAEDGQILRGQPIVIEISKPPPKKQINGGKHESRKSRTNLRIEPATSENVQTQPRVKMSNEDFRNLLKKNTITE